jgi:hypothetical protein
VAGPPTSTPTVNLSALGLGVLEICTAISLPDPSALRTLGLHVRIGTLTAHGSATGRPA